jgi:hypothetical protein
MSTVVVHGDGCVVSIMEVVVTKEFGTERDLTPAQGSCSLFNLIAS